MGKTVRVNADISEDLNASLERLAEEQGQSKDALIERALRALVQSEEQFMAAVEEGLAAWRGGDVVEHSDVVAEFAGRYGRAQ